MACLAVALLPLSGAQAATSAASGATIQVTDLANRTVRIPAKVDRILLGEGRLLPPSPCSTARTRPVGWWA